mmetsp:Transcript_109226/g.348670  ORF Transcript_109226/g.348670 Transcript_109226/m.348670 type:complete len:350 (-) Transcript_109226:1149-2198(-)
MHQHLQACSYASHRNNSSSKALADFNTSWPVQGAQASTYCSADAVAIGFPEHHKYVRCLGRCRRSFVASTHNVAIGIGFAIVVLRQGSGGMKHSNALHALFNLVLDVPFFLVLASTIAFPFLLERQRHKVLLEDPTRGKQIVLPKRSLVDVTTLPFENLSDRCAPRPTGRIPGQLAGGQGQESPWPDAQGHREVVAHGHCGGRRRGSRWVLGDKHDGEPSPAGRRGHRGAGQHPGRGLDRGLDLGGAVLEAAGHWDRLLRLLRSLPICSAANDTGHRDIHPASTTGEACSIVKVGAWQHGGATGLQPSASRTAELHTGCGDQPPEHSGRHVPAGLGVDSREHGAPRCRE